MIFFLFRLPSDFFESGKKAGKPSSGQPIKSILTNSDKPLLSQYGSESESDDDEGKAPPKTVTTGLPKGMLTDSALSIYNLNYLALNLFCLFYGSVRI